MKSLSQRLKLKQNEFNPKSGGGSIHGNEIFYLHYSCRLYLNHENKQLASGYFYGSL